MYELDKVLSDGPGYKSFKALKRKEISWLHGYLNDRLKCVLRDQSALTNDIIERISISNYHDFSDMIDHETIWKRTNRLFCPDGIKFVENTGFFKALIDYYGDIRITNEIHQSGPEIVWRIARPNAENDVGPIHADKWFWDINGWPIGDGKKLVKLWMLLQGSSGTGGGLLIKPFSQVSNQFSYSVIEVDGVRKPVIDRPSEKIVMENLSADPGDAVIFSYQLLHAGGITSGKQCRVSIELTLEVSDGK